jgi:tetratricopeptide (TPR) repeat protein
LLKQDPWSVGEDAGVAFLLYGLAKVTEAQVRPESAANYRQDAFRILSAGNATNACTFKLAVLVREEGDLDLALRLARQSLRVRERGRSEWVLHPVRLSATLLEDLGEAREAKAVLRHGVDLYEEYQEEGLYHAGVALGNFVWALLERGMIAEAESIAERELDGSNAKIMNALAWFYATSPDPTLRNGEKAVRIAEKSVAETSRNDANILDTLAAAYAEVGDFPKAISVQKEAIALLAGEEKRKSGEFLERLNLYESGQPYHEEAEVHDTASSD